MKLSFLIFSIAVGPVYTGRISKTKKIVSNLWKLNQSDLSLTVTCAVFLEIDLPIIVKIIKRAHERGNKIHHAKGIVLDHLINLMNHEKIVQFFKLLKSENLYRRCDYTKSLLCSWMVPWPSVSEFIKLNLSSEKVLDYEKLLKCLENLNDGSQFFSTLKANAILIESEIFSSDLMEFRFLMTISHSKELISFESMQRVFTLYKNIFQSENFSERLNNFIALNHSFINDINDANAKKNLLIVLFIKNEYLASLVHPNSNEILSLKDVDANLQKVLQTMNSSELNSLIWKYARVIQLYQSKMINFNQSMNEFRRTKSDLKDGPVVRGYYLSLFVVHFVSNFLEAKELKSTEHQLYLAQYYTIWEILIQNNDDGMLPWRIGPFINYLIYAGTWEFLKVSLDYIERNLISIEKSFYPFFLCKNLLNADDELIKRFFKVISQSMRLTNDQQMLCILNLIKKYPQYYERIKHIVEKSSIKGFFGYVSRSLFSELQMMRKSKADNTLYEQQVKFMIENQLLTIDQKLLLKLEHLKYPEHRGHFFSKKSNVTKFFHYLTSFDANLVKNIDFNLTGEFVNLLIELYGSNQIGRLEGCLSGISARLAALELGTHLIKLFTVISDLKYFKENELQIILKSIYTRSIRTAFDERRFKILERILDYFLDAGIDHRVLINEVGRSLIYNPGEHALVIRFCEKKSLKLSEKIIRRLSTVSSVNANTINAIVPVTYNLSSFEIIYNIIHAT